MTNTALTLLLILIVVIFSCSNHEEKVAGEWEGRYRWHRGAEFAKVRMRFKGNEVFCYENNGNNIGTWMIRGDSINITFSDEVIIRARLNKDNTFISGNGFFQPEFRATKKATSNLKRYKRAESLDEKKVTGKWIGHYRYRKDAEFQKEKIVFEGEEAFFYHEGGRNHIASWQMKNDSIILIFPGDVTIRGIINADRTKITGKQFTPSDPDGDPGEFIASKQ
jgi:hypothetical protein